MLRLRTHPGRGIVTLDSTMQVDSRSLALAFAGCLTGALAASFALAAMEPLPATVLFSMTIYCLAEFMERARGAPESAP